MEEAEEGEGGQRKDRSGMALREDVIGAPTGSTCTLWRTNDKYPSVYAVEYKAPDNVPIPELVAGLHPMNLARDVIDQEGDTLEFMPTRLVVAMFAQIFLYMIDSGIRYGYICTM
ncbi:hypothetical protein CBS147353_11717 [Aspergillus niger]|nr:hypothetical protein CBS147353_11717 [Aspergillus niger]